MTIGTPFSPGFRSTIAIAATTTVGLNFTLPLVPADGTLRLVNAGTAVAFFSIGAGTGVTALVAAGTALGDMCIYNGAALIIDRGNATNIAAVCKGADVTTIYVTAGQGGV